MEWQLSDGQGIAHLESRIRKTAGKTFSARYCVEFIFMVIKFKLLMKGKYGGALILCLLPLLRLYRN